MKKLIEKIEKVKVNPRYDIFCDDYSVILKHCEGNTVKAMCYSFLAGYMQGAKAEKARLRKSKLKNESVI